MLSECMHINSAVEIYKISIQFIYTYHIVYVKKFNTNMLIYGTNIAVVY